MHRPIVVGGPLDVVVDEGRGEGDDLEVVGAVTGPRPGEPFGQRRLEGLDRVGGEEDGEPTVGDLGGQGDVLRSLGSQDDRDLLAQRMHDGLERLARARCRPG